jgi:hypothetical protein
VPPQAAIDICRRRSLEPLAEGDDDNDEGYIVSSAGSRQSQPQSLASSLSSSTSITIPIPEASLLQAHSPRGRTAQQAAAAKAAQRAAEQDAAVKEFHGVAGHGGMFTQGGRIYKPLIYEENEWHVYEAIRMHLPELLPWIPRVYERTVVNGSPFIVMEDLTFGYQRPVVLDLKVGEPSDFYRMHNQPYALKVAGYTGDDVVRRS